MDLLKKIGFIGASFLVLTGCSGRDIKIEKSSVLHEPAVVVDLIYIPSRHGSGTSPQIGFNGDGELSLGLEFTSMNMPEKYGAVFKCQHGNFPVSGPDSSYQALWSKLSEGDSVDVSYQEIYRNTYEDSNGGGNKELISSELVDYDFLDATKK